MTKAVSFCLYGTSKLYLNKFFLNVPYYKSYFFDFDLLLYADVRLKNDLEIFCNENNIKIFFRTQHSVSDGMFWRFDPIFNLNYDVLLVRDIDYTPCHFELDLINSFINSNLSFHIIRSDFNHKMPIMGGLFAIKRNLYNLFEMYYRIWEVKHSKFKINYNDDQLFLANYIYGKVVLNSMIHTSNVVFYGEKYQIITPPSNFIMGGDDRHFIDKEKNSYIYIYLPVRILKYLKFRAMNYFRLKFKK